MPTLAYLDGDDLDKLWDILKVCAPDNPKPVWGIAFWVDPQDGGLKVKVDQGIWTPAMGITIERP